MQDKKNADKISLLQAFLVPMVSVALLFLLLSAGIWFYTTDVLRHENALISRLLPELDGAYQLAEATAGLQSQKLLLFSSSDENELRVRSLQVDAVISRARIIVSILANQKSSVHLGLAATLDDLSMLKSKLIDVKTRQFILQRRIEEKKRSVVAVFVSIEKPVQRQIVRLTDQLLEISEQMADSVLVDRAEHTANRALEFEAINLAIQDYLLFAQDVVSLHAVIEKLPLLVSAESVDQSIQRRDLLLRSLVNRSIYFQEEGSTSELLESMRDLHNLLNGNESMFDLQNSILQEKENLTEIGELMPGSIASILKQTDLLRDDLQLTVSRQAEKNLASLDIYRVLLVVVCAVALMILAGIFYWLVYRKTVLPLMQIIQQLDDVGSERFASEVKPYFLKEFSQLSSALIQLDQAQKNMYLKDVQMQIINDNLKNANLELEQFAHVASHDLQEPLRKLQQFSDLLEEDYSSDLDDDGRFFVASIRNSAKRMSRLISDTLAFSRADRGNQMMEPVDLSLLLVQLLDEMDVAVADAEDEINVDALPVVIASSLGMTQLFRNLLTNALKYRKPDTPSRVSIRAVGLNFEDNSALLIQVEDNGVGIKQEYLQRIFQPFERLHTDGVRGTGLGLAICKKVCKVHKWGLEVHSEPGVGSTFEIRIPEHSLQRY